MGALEFLCSTRFHKSLTLPPNPSTNRLTPLRVTYSDFGAAESSNVVLFCGGLFGTRLTYAVLDRLAKEKGVRIVCPDRPGIGGTGDDGGGVRARVALWLEIVPSLLTHLSIPYVSLGSHSAGTIYAFNILLSYPHLLHPTTPSITFFAPWVHQSHTKVAKLQAAALLPASLIGGLSPLAKFVNGNVMPVVASSGGLLKGMRTSLSNPSTPTSSELSSTSADRGSDDASAGLETLDLNLDDAKVVAELRNHIATFVFAEELAGVSEDAQLLLRKPASEITAWCPASSARQWTDIDDIPALLSQLVDEEKALGRERKWCVDVFHAESDHMTGDRGRSWFDECWKKEETKGRFAYRSKVVVGGDHDFLVDPGVGASRVWLERLGEIDGGERGT